MCLSGTPSKVHHMVMALCHTSLDLNSSSDEVSVCRIAVGIIALVIRKKICPSDGYHTRAQFGGGDKIMEQTPRPLSLLQHPDWELHPNSSAGDQLLSDSVQTCGLVLPDLGK